MQTLLIGGALLGPATAWAGEVRFGAEEIAVDDSGNITAEGKSSATTTLKSEPGEELWTLNVWAKIDKGAPGPLYVEFVGELPGGKEYVTYRYEHSDYDGEKFVSLSFDLEGNSGFNKGKTYKVKVLQAAAKEGRPDIVFATGKLTLEFTEAEPEDEDEDEGEGGDPDDNAEAQDEFDTLAGPDDGAGDGAGEGPPPVDPESKKGCSVGSTDLGAPAVAALFILGLVRRRND